MNTGCMHARLPPAHTRRQPPCKRPMHGTLLTLSADLCIPLPLPPPPFPETLATRSLPLSPPPLRTPFPPPPPPARNPTDLPPSSMHLQPLSVELGPGLLGTMFDGIQRPLKAIAQGSGSYFIPRGVDVPALDRSILWEFHPAQYKVGVRVGGWVGWVVWVCGRVDGWVGWVHGMGRWVGWSGRVGGWGGMSVNAHSLTFDLTLPHPPAPPTTHTNSSATASPAATSTAPSTRTR